MTTPNIKDETRKLIELQELDKQVFTLSKEKAGHPDILENLLREFETQKMKLKSLEESKQKFTLKQKEKEMDLATKEENIKKAQGQLGQLKTNKDYQTKLAEIEGLRTDKSVIEEDILKLMDEVDAIKKTIEEEKRGVDTAEHTYMEKKNCVLDRGREIDATLKDMGGKRRVAAGVIDKKVLEQYEHILHGRDGLALVKVADHSCNGCFMKVPHQVINEIKMHERLITCETCSRILYLEEDALL